MSVIACSLKLRSSSFVVVGGAGVVVVEQNQMVKVDIDHGRQAE
jgi:hypothetical protein